MSTIESFTKKQVNVAGPFYLEQLSNSADSANVVPNVSLIMNNELNVITFDALQYEIASKIDLTNILQKVAKDNEWTDSFASKVSKEYMKFLYIIKHNGSGAVPSKMVDLVWHQHILDTKRYKKDMYAVFDQFIHHNPSYTLKQRDETSNKYTIFKEKYFVTFGEMPDDVWTNKKNNDCNGLCVSDCTCQCDDDLPDPSLFVKHDNNINVTNYILQNEISSKLHLSYILKKVARDNGWSDEFTYKAAEEYMKFLYVIKQYGSGAVPSRIVDLIWHQHILDTRIYMIDMNNIFARYIHHNPSYTVQERRETSDKFKIFKQRYFSEFGEMPDDIWPDSCDESIDANECDHDCEGLCSNDDCANECAHDCKNQCNGD